MPTEDQLAALYGLDVLTYRAIRSGFDAMARQAATDLLADASFAAQVDRLPFAAGDTVVALGDSISADLQGWATILRHVIALRRPEPVVPLAPMFGEPPSASLLSVDGLHPSLTGQREIVRALVTRLAG